MRHPRIHSDMNVYRLPAPPAPAIQPAAFALCPALSMPQCAAQWPMVQQLYLWAFEQAQAVAKPSLPERDLLAVWN